MLLSVIPYDSQISRKKLIRLWIAEGFVKQKADETLEITAEKYLMELINRSMIEVAIEIGRASCRERVYVLV